MGAEPPPPWSRWDGPGVTYNPPPLIRQPFGDTSANGNVQTVQGFLQSTGLPQFVQGAFNRVRQEDDPTDSGYYRCFYVDSSNPGGGEIPLQCLKRLGCCQTGCCDWTEDSSWTAMRAAAIALIVIFAIIVIIAIIVWLVSWFFSRNKDKQQKKELLSSSGSPSVVQSQVSGAYPASGVYAASGGGAYAASGVVPPSGKYRVNGVNSGYYPYVGGPYKYQERF